jgi:hypothetical protein
MSLFVSQKQIRWNHQAGLSLGKLLQPSEQLAGQRKALERAMDHLLKDKCLLAA